MTQLFNNNVDSALSATLSESATSMSLQDASGLSEPSGGDFELLTIMNGDGVEIVKMTARSGNTLTVERAQEGTAAQEWLMGTRVFADVTAGTLTGSLRNSEGTALDVSAKDTDESLSIGGFSSTDGAGATALGYYAGANAQNSTAIGNYAYAPPDGGLSVGSTAYTMTKRTAHVAAVMAVPASGAWNDAEGDLHWQQSSAESLFATSEIDLKSAGAITIAMPDGLHGSQVVFFPDSASLIITEANGVTGQPTIRLGATGDEARYLAAVATTGLDAQYKRQVFDLLTPDGTTTLRAEVTVAGAGTTLKGRVIWRGMAVVDL